MDFVGLVDQVMALLRQRGRVTYRTLQRQFQLVAGGAHRSAATGGQTLLQTGAVIGTEVSWPLLQALALAEELGMRPLQAYCTAAWRCCAARSASRSMPAASSRPPSRCIARWG